MATKVVSALEMARIEQWSIGKGANQKQFMESAGRRVATVAKELLEKRGGKNVVLVVGKGNKGGDAYVAGNQLREWGFSVRVCPLFERSECSELNQLFAVDGKKDFDFSGDDLIIDGLLGTGFHGKVAGEFLVVIEAINSSGKAVLSIDIPSGLDGSTGEGRHAVKATATTTMGLAKTGLFIQDGWNCTGLLTVEDFGLPIAAAGEARAEYLLSESKLLTLPKMTRTQNKYSRGFVLGFCGSSAYPGSIKLSCKAALHSGAGIVKAFCLENIGPTEDELIIRIWDSSGWMEGVKKAQAVFVGPGLGRSLEAKAWLETHLKTIHQPCVIDADALFFLPEISIWPDQVVLTPHRGEMLHLLGEKQLTDQQLHWRCREFVEKRRVTLLLKGAPTFVFAPGCLPMIVKHGDPGMATAGSGDVLTGVIASLLSQGMTLFDAAILGATLHGLSGETAASIKTSYGYTASDLIDHLSDALKLFTR